MVRSEPAPGLVFLNPKTLVFKRDLSGFRAGDRFLMVCSGPAPGRVFLMTSSPTIMNYLNVHDLSGLRAGDRFLMVCSEPAPGLVFLKLKYLNVTCPGSGRLIVLSWSFLGLLRDKFPHDPKPNYFNVTCPISGRVIVFY